MTALLFWYVFPPSAVKIPIGRRARTGRVVRPCRPASLRWRRSPERSIQQGGHSVLLEMFEDAGKHADGLAALFAGITPLAQRHVNPTGHGLQEAAASAEQR